MANKLGSLFGKQTGVYAAATATNHEGAPAFVRSDEESVIRVLMTGTFEPTFYASAGELAAEALATFRAMRDKDPQFLAKAIVYAREKGYMRTAPITALAILSTGNEDAKEMFRKIFPRVIQTPGDLQDFVMLCRHSKIRGAGPVVHKAVQGWLSGISEYHVIKYGAESQTMSLRDMYRIARPKLFGKAQQIARYVVKGDWDPNDTVSATQLFGYEQFKHLAKQKEVSTAELLKIVEAHRLPWEVVTAHLPATTEVWTAMMHQMPYMALLRNLRNLIKYQVFADPKELQFAVNKLSDEKNVAASKQFPFRFWSALKAIGDDAPFTLRLAVEYALETSFVNMPPLGDNVLICNDVSGSMQNPVAAKSDMTMAEIAAVFAAACYKKAERGKIVSFNQTALPRVIPQGVRMSDIARTITAEGGGTSLSAPLAWAFGGRAPEYGYGWSRTPVSVVEADPQTFDTAIFITDNESWVDHLKSNSGVADRIKEYREKRNPNLRVFFIQLMPYRTSQVPQEMEGVYYISGWSNDVVNFIGNVVNGGADQVEAVRQYGIL